MSLPGASKATCLPASSTISSVIGTIGRWSPMTTTQARCPPLNFTVRDHLPTTWPPFLASKIRVPWSGLASLRRAHSTTPPTSTANAMQRIIWSPLRNSARRTSILPHHHRDHIGYPRQAFHLNANWACLCRDPFRREVVAGDQAQVIVATHAIAVRVEDIQRQVAPVAPKGNGDTAFVGNKPARILPMLERSQFHFHKPFLRVARLHLRSASQGCPE